MVRVPVLSNTTALTFVALSIPSAPCAKFK